jgi:hypothetical protein
MKIVIQIFCLPYEIDELENTLNRLRTSSHYINTSNQYQWVIDVTMCTADDMVNWSKSSIPKKYFEDKLLKLSWQTDWCDKYFRTSSDIKGCVSHRRYCLERYNDADYFLWLDTDIIFDERTLSHLENSLQPVSNINPYNIITPEFVRIWDNTWDVLVNENFIDKPLGYQKDANPYLDSGIKGDISIEGVLNSASPQSRFKFAGGWFTCISGDLLRKIGIPKSFGHYGYEDTFIMVASEKLVRTSDIKINQFKIKNVVVCENYKYRNHTYYLNNISAYDRREEFKKIALDNFNKELEKIN